MRIGAIVKVAAAAMVAVAPYVAHAAVNVTATTSAGAGSAAAGSTVSVTCSAEGAPESGMLGSTTYTVNQVDVTVDGGTVTPATLTGAVTQPCSLDATKTCSVLTGTVAWVTSATAGTYTVTCTATATKAVSSFGGTTTSTVTQAGTASLTTVVSATQAPVISSLSGPTGDVLTGSSVTFTVSATDPNVPPGRLTYEWSASAGTIAGSGETATWTVPDVAGTYTVTVVVTNGTGQTSTANATANAILGGYQGSLAVAMMSPSRLATDGAGNVYAVDSYTKTLLLLTAKGELKGAAPLGEAPTAVASGPGVLYVATTNGKLLKVDPATAKVKGEIALAGGPLNGVAGMAYEPTRMRIWAVERASSRVRVVQPDGTTAFYVAFTGSGAPLADPMDVAVDAAGSRVWVLLQEGVAGTKMAHAYDLDGKYLVSAVDWGQLAGQVTRGGGVAVDGGGRLYVSDSFQGVVQAYGPTGGSLGTYGAWGTMKDGPGKLYGPGGLGFLGNGNLLVANSGHGEIERFGAVSELPTCAGDADCDGLSDAWEQTHGLNGAFAGDVFLDRDGDGLSNAEEYAYGTDPTKKDTDGDGFEDGWELANGFDPLNPNDHNPTVMASGPVDARPGLVKLTASVVGGAGECAVSWTQSSGPETVTLRGTPGLTPSFIGRKAGTYAFKARATCGRYVSAVATAEAKILDVPPLVTVDGIRVVSPGALVTVDASGTSDANEASGTVLRYAWDQVLGAPLSFYGTGALLTVQTGGEGYQAFAVTAKDPAGNVAVGEVPVLVASGPSATVLVATPVRGEVGTEVKLDAAGSYVPGAGWTFGWEQVDGPAAALDTTAGSVARFVPGAAGRYAFRAWLTSGDRRSPPGRIDVYVAEAGGSLPAAVIGRVGPVAVGTAVVLDGSGSAGSGLRYEWKQVRGPAAGLDDPGSATPTVVPFGAGSHEFELVVKEGAVEGPPARVRFDAVVAGKTLPVALAVRGSVPTKAGDVAVLDGTGSRGAEKYHWTQVSGPWAVLDDAGSPAPSFVVPAAGRYVFELVVEGRGVRSAPSTVKVVVGGR